MTDFLLELRSEEIPARMQAGARASLEKLFREQMNGAGVSFGTLTIWSTPRRLALIARDMPLATAAVSEELKGPKVGAPPQALEGFLRKTGLTEGQLTQRDGAYFAVREVPPCPTPVLLADAIFAVAFGFPWPKSMRWGEQSKNMNSLRWVRPLSGIVALLGEEIVDVNIDGIQSGRTTMGHRFHHSGEITIGNAADYATKLRAAHVIVDHAEREAIIRTGAAKAAADAGLMLVEDEGLVIENAGLIEWPVPLLGRFDPEFLEVPPEVIQLTARTNQKYFICRDSSGKLANAFVCTANIAASDGGAGVVDGNRKVLAARLSDARFFWEQDRKKTLEQHAEKLANIVFHEKLGTVADKVERVAKLARWLVEEGIVKPTSAPAKAGASGLSAQPPEAPAFAGDQAELANLAEQAARLCKADLTTEMVGEFPELQGLMGGYYARAEGLPGAVADAIRDHYKPVGQGDEVPTAPVTVAVSLADKLDTIAQFFAIDEKPTGSKDPFALRRAALGIIALVQKNAMRLPLHAATGQAFANSPLNENDEAGFIPKFSLTDQKVLNSLDDLADAYLEFGSNLKIKAVCDQLVEAILAASSFFADRLKVQQREAGVRHDLIDAVFALGGEDDLVRLLARVHALQAFVATPDGANLLAGYKRAANILKKEGVVPAQAGTAGLVDATSEPRGQRSPVEPGTTNALSYTPELAEKGLMDALSTAGSTAAAAVAAEDFAGAMAALASLRAPIDEFFDNVTVNDADPAKRSARLGLLAAFRDAVHGVADFSKIEG